jgi:hypothetical protein
MVYASGRAAATAGEIREAGKRESVEECVVPFMVAVVDCVVCYLVGGLDSSDDLVWICE